MQRLSRSGLFSFADNSRTSMSSAMAEPCFKPDRPGNFLKMVLYISPRSHISRSKSEAKQASTCGAS